MSNISLWQVVVIAIPFGIAGSLLFNIIMKLLVKFMMRNKIKDEMKVMKVIKEKTRYLSDGELWNTIKIIKKFVEETPNYQLEHTQAVRDLNNYFELSKKQRRKIDKLKTELLEKNSVGKGCLNNQNIYGNIEEQERVELLEWLKLPSFKRYAVDIINLKVLEMRNEIVDCGKNKEPGWQQSKQNLIGIMRQLEKDAELIQKIIMTRERKENAKNKNNS